MKSIKQFTLLFFFVLTAVVGYAQGTACFSNGIDSAAGFPIARCQPISLVLKNCSPHNYDSVIWKVSYDTAVVYKNEVSSFTQTLVDTFAPHDFNYQVSLNGSYKVTLYLYKHPNTFVDSITKIAAIYTPTFYTFDTINACIGSTILWGGHPAQHISTSHQLIIDSLKSIEGCDSFVYLHITFYPTPAPVVITQYVCPGTPYNFNGKMLSMPGTYDDTIPSFANCDSIIRLKLFTHNPIPPKYYTDIVCPNEFAVFFGDTLRQTGTYFDTLHSYLGCDSIIALNLTVLTGLPTVNLYDTICSNGSYIFNGKPLTAAGFYIDTVPAFRTTCDSVNILHLAIRPALPATDFYDSVCKGSVYHLGLSAFSLAGVYTVPFKNVHGCDSVIMLHLKVIDINPSLKLVGNTLIAHGDGTIKWYEFFKHQIIANKTDTSFTPTTTGTYAAIFTHGNCNDTTSPIYDTLVLGIEQVMMNNERLTIYPNPATEWLMVNGKLLIGNTIAVYDLVGRLKLSVILSNSVENPDGIGKRTQSSILNQQIINVEGLPSGIYFLKATNSKGFSQTVKFVKE